MITAIIATLVASVVAFGLAMKWGNSSAPESGEGVLAIYALLAAGVFFAGFVVMAFVKAVFL